MKPISEMGGPTYLKSKEYYPYYGRGYVQLTWDYNYKKAGAKLGVDFISQPSLLLQPQYAAPILVIGMLEGWFTGKKLSDYETLQGSDYLDSRREINGMDKAALIAGYAETYEKLLLDIGYGVDSPAASPTPTPKPVQPSPASTVLVTTVAPIEPPVPVSTSWLSIVANAIKWFIKAKYGQ
jgi:hypothetical protein